MPQVQPSHVRGGLGIKTRRPRSDNGRPAELQQGGPPPEQRRYVRHVPWDIRLHNWAASWAITPRDDAPGWFPRWTRFKRWARTVYPRVRKFIKVIWGGRTTDTEAAERDRICDTCPVLRIRLPARPEGRIRRFCGSCGCPDWPLSELSYKNTLARHRCPHGKHPGPPDWATELIEQAERDRRAKHGDT